MKKRNWVSLIDDNTNKNTRKFVSLNECNAKKDVKENNVKSMILASTLFDVVERYFRKPMVLESKDAKGGFFGSSSWKDFEEHAKLMAQFMDASDKEIDETLNKMKQAFKSISGEEGQGGVEKGFEMISTLEEALKESGVEDNGSSSGVIPKIKIRHFLDILYDAETNTTYDVGIFINMITERKNNNLAKLIYSSKDNISLGDIIKNKFKQKFGDNIQEAYDIFNKVIRVDNYSKNGTNIGKAELALALFFGDCALPDSQGDIVLTVGKHSGTSIEVKGTDAVFTNRTVLFKDINRISWSDIKNINDSNYGLDDNSIEKTLDLYNPEVLDLNQGNISEQILTLVNRIDDLEPINSNNSEDQETEPLSEGRRIQRMTNEKVAAKFKVLFGALFRSYADGKTTSKRSKKTNKSPGFDIMLFLNTQDKSPLTQTAVKVHPDKSNKNWYQDGIRILNQLLNNKIDVSFQDAYGSGGAFKAIMKQ